MFVLFLLVLVHNSNIKLQLTPQEHYLVLYTSCPSQETDSEEKTEMKRLNFRINFRSSDFVLSSEWKEHTLYLDKNLLKPLDYRVNVQYEIYQTPPLSNQQNNHEELHGEIGLNKYSEFFDALKLTLDVNDVKLWFHLRENFIQVLPSTCKKPIFPPFDISLYSHVKHENFQIKSLSLQFHPKARPFIELFGRKKGPLVLYNEQLNKKFYLGFRNEVQEVVARQLLGKQCLKQSSFQCQFKQQPKDVGMLLFYFDPILCSNIGAIELIQEAQVSTMEYYWIHVTLIIMQFLVMWACHKQVWGNLKLNLQDNKHR